MSVQLAVLGKLVEGSSYPYALAGELNASPASIYQAANRLVSLGHIEPVTVERGARQRNYFRATVAGVAEYRERVAKDTSNRREQFRARLRRAVTADEALNCLDAYESWLICESERPQLGSDLGARLHALLLQSDNEACLRFVTAARKLVTVGGDV